MTRHLRPLFCIVVGTLVVVSNGMFPLGPIQALAQQTITINGAGATFPFPLIDTWRNEYQKVNPEVNINYQSIGSGGGVKQFTEKTVDFGASDAPLSAAERENAPNAVHIPETIGSIVVSYNLPIVPEKGLRLSGPVLADIFLGNIKKWNDPSIISLNPEVDLPDSSILVVHRSDGSGTTYVWTDYLSKVSPEWGQEIGVGKSVEWATGIGAPGNEGVANAIKGNAYTIGYIELSYALSTSMPYAFLQNKEGNFIEPSFDSIKAAISVSTSSLPKGDESWSSVSTTDAEGSESYPIASFSYLLLYKEFRDNTSINKEKAIAIFEFVSWAITDGQQYSDDLGYIPLPEQIVKINQETLQMLTFDGKPVSLLATEEGELIPVGLNNNFLLIAAVATAAGIAVAVWRVKTRRDAQSSKLPMQQAQATDSKNLGKKTISSFFLKSSIFGDRIFQSIVLGTAGYTVFLMALITYSAFAGSWEVFSKEGFFGFITGTDWNPVEGRESFGALPYIIGTLASAGIAMVIGVPISIGIATFVSEISPRRLATPLSFVVELLAAVPSIIYGLWALFVFSPLIKGFIEIPLHEMFGDTIPLFARTPFGLDIFTAGIVLAIMIIPTVSSISREVMRAVPTIQREAAYSLGATRWETVRTAVFPYARSGLLGASILGLGRAVGETMLVTMVIGNAIGPSAIPTTLFSPSQSLASLIANEFNEAVTSLHTSALIGLGAVLLLLTIVINIGARLLVARITRVGSGRHVEKVTKHGMNQSEQLRQAFAANSALGIRSPSLESGSISHSDLQPTAKKTIQVLVRKQSSQRKITNVAITSWAVVCVVVAIIPLGSILLEVIKNGAPAISIEFLTQAPGSVASGDASIDIRTLGGIAPAIQGTLLVVGLATMIGAPIGVLAGIFLAEYAGAKGNSNRFAHAVRLFSDVLTGVPSIVIGIVGYVAIVLTTGSFSVWAGAFALSIIMIPIVVRVTEETLKIVPNSIREAAYSLGIPRWKIALFIILPTAKSGVLTGIVLAISRITGETAPLIMTILGSSFFWSGSGPLAAMPLQTWRFATQPWPSAHTFGWGTALVLILIVLGLSISVRLLSQKRGSVFRYGM